MKILGRESRSETDKTAVFITPGRNWTFREVRTGIFVGKAGAGKVYITRVCFHALAQSDGGHNTIKRSR